MSSIFFIIFLVMLFGKNKRDNLASDLIKFLIIFSLLGTAVSSLLFFPFGFVGIIPIVMFIVITLKMTKKIKERKEQYGWDPLRWDKERGNQNQTYDACREDRKNGGKRKALPAAAAKRKKIVEAFNTKYALYLTPEQIKGIVDASYMSKIWKEEVEAMAQKYETVYEWFQGSTKWLRVYLHAFHVQEVTSDIRQQENICMYAFEEIFQYAELFPDCTLAEKIRAVNDKFYTAFDDASFMIAYRFLESKEKHHDLGIGKIVREEDDVDRLLHKYDTQKM